MDQQTSATINLIGMLFDAAGGLYLAYDLLGGEKGPLSTFTRVFTYSLIITVIYTVAMGLRFGLLAGVSLGVAIGLHLDRLNKDLKDTRPFLFGISLLRSIGLGCAVGTIDGAISGVFIGIIVFSASMILPIFGISPELLKDTGKRPSLSKQKLMLTLIFLGIAILCDVLFIALGINQTQTSVPNMIKITSTVAVAIFFVSYISPTIEWYADNVEPRRLGYLGVVLFTIGFFIQALPSLVTVMSK